MNDEPPFGFKLARPGAKQWDRPYDSAAWDWVLYLPHSCDEWIIATGPDKAKVLREAERFRAELDSAIARLREESE